jgi:hypothetical protein
MRKRSEIDGFRPEGILLKSIGIRRYSDRDLDAIISASSASLPLGQLQVQLPRWWSDLGSVSLTRRQALAVQLEIAAALYFRDREWAKAPSPSQLRARFEKINASAAALMRTLGLGTRNRSNADLIPFAILSRLRLHAAFPSSNGHDRVRDAVSSIKTIYEWTERELWMARARTAGELVNKGDKPFNEFLMRLGTIWSEVFEQKPRVSFIGGNSSKRHRPCGPFFAFVASSLEPLKLSSKQTGAMSLGDRLDRLFGPKKKRRPKHLATSL